MIRSSAVVTKETPLAPRGLVTAEPAIVRYYLYPDAAVNGNRALATREVAALAAGGVSSGTTVLNVPFVPPGAYHILACVDTSDDPERSEDCRAATATVELRLPTP